MAGKHGPEIRYHLDESVRTAIAVGLRSHAVDVTTTPKATKLQPGRVLAIVTGKGTGVSDENACS